MALRALRSASRALDQHDNRREPMRVTPIEIGLIATLIAIALIVAIPLVLTWL